MTQHLVIFDVDGTLVDSQGHIVAALTRAFEAEGLEVPSREVALSGVGLSIEAFMARLAPPAHQEGLVRTYCDAYAELRQRGESPLYPGTGTMLARLAAREDIEIALATGKSRRGLNALISEHGWGAFLASDQSADEHPSKPHPSMIHAVLSETGIPAQRAVMVGDTSYDMEMARAAGLRAIGVPWGYHPASSLKADAMIAGWPDLEPTLARLWSETL